MPVYTAEIAGKPTVVFAALDLVHALGFVNDSFIIAELRALRAQDGAPLWPADTGLAIRPATEGERLIWEQNLAQDLTAGVHESREDAIKSNGFTFLVSHLEPEE